MTSGISFSQFSISEDPLKEVQDSKQSILLLGKKALKLVKFSEVQIRLIYEITLDPNIEFFPYCLGCSMEIKDNLLKLIQNIKKIVGNITQIETELYSSDNLCDILYNIEQIDIINIQSCFIEYDLVSLDCALLVTTITTIDLLKAVAKDKFNEIAMLEQFEF